MGIMVRFPALSALEYSVLIRLAVALNTLLLNGPQRPLSEEIGTTMVFSASRPAENERACDALERWVLIGFVHWGAMMEAQDALKEI